jgi:hypothetical protein
LTGPWALLILELIGGAALATALVYVMIRRRLRRWLSRRAALIAATR